MTTKTIHTFCFSPTGTSHKIAEAVTRGAQGDAETMFHDLTRSELPRLHCMKEELAVFAVPVYGGHVAPCALQRLDQVTGDDTPTVLIAVYGNRAFEHTLEELSDFVSRRGFVPVAAGAFIGEHSYSTEEYPIAVERPDADDLEKAGQFGREIARKAEAGLLDRIEVEKLKDSPVSAETMQRFGSFIMQYRRQQSEHPVISLPATDENICGGCGACVAVCPTQAIDSDDVFSTDPSRCIRCCACVKVCKTGARHYETPFSKALSENFSLRKEPVTLL